ncbi:MAG: polysaccharide biosynthesis/export family protein [Roseiarcus sp.]
MMKWFWAPILVVALSSAAKADDAYVIGKGDVVEIDVLNLPVLHRRLTVGPDGKIAMPVLGALVADGLTLDQLQDALRKQLIEKNVVRDPNVAIAIAEYRPVFVNGDVGKPGDYAYRADLTVRKAIAVAGGYGPLVESRGLAPLMETARAKGDIGSLAIEVAKQRLKVLRLTAELADQPELSVARPPDASVDPELFGNLAKTEVAQFAADKADRETQRGYFDRMLQTARGELEFLNRASQQQEQMLSQQMAAATRAHDLLQRGVGTMIRSEDEDREIGLLQWQILDVQARLKQAEGRIADATRQLQGYDDQRKIRLLTELREASAEVGKLGQQLGSARDRLKYAGGVGMLPDSLAQVVIYRSVNGAQQRLDADQDTPLMPGDMVQITVPATPRRLY